MHEPNVTIYSTRVCGYCERAKMLLKRKGVEYTELLVDEDPAARKEMEELSGRRTVPQIFISGKHIGGFEDMYALDRSGELNALLDLEQN